MTGQHALKSHRASPLAVAAILFAAACSLGGGCSGTAGVRAGDAHSLTGGAALSIYLTDGDHSHAYYVVRPDGGLEFAGGYDAVRRRTTWSGALTAEEAARLHALFEANAWFADPPQPGHHAALRGDDRKRHEIHFAHPGGSWRYHEPVGSPQIAPVHDFIRDIATAKRHSDLFDGLPEPGPRRN